MTRNRNSLLLLVFFLTPFFAAAQQIAPIGSWTSYLSHYNVKEIAERNNVLYVISDGGLFTFNKSTGEKRTYNTIDGLSSIESNTIYYDPVSDFIFLGFNDGTINYFRDFDDIHYITDIARSEAFTIKSVYRFFSQDGILYIATDFGIVAYDIAQNETKSSFTKIGNNTTGAPVLGLTLFEDEIWISMGDKGVYHGSLNHPNLADPNAWVKESGINNLPLGLSKFITNTTDALYTQVKDTVYRKVGGVWETTPLLVRSLDYLAAYSDIVVATRTNYTEFLLPNDQVTPFFFNLGRAQCGFSDGTNYYVGDARYGLQQWFSGNPDYTDLTPKGPTNNFVSQIIAGENEFYIAPIGREGSNRKYLPYGVYYFNTREDYTGDWKILSEANGDFEFNSVFRDFHVGTYDSKTQTAYIGSMGEGLVSLKHGEVKQVWPQDSTSMTGFIIPGPDVRITGLEADQAGNLWVVRLLSPAYENLSVKSAEGEWTNYSLTGTRAVDILIDDYDNKWIANENGGLTVFNENGTLFDKNDDRKRTFTTSIGNGNLPAIDVASIEKDKNGHVWVGTGDGVTVFYDPYDPFVNTFPDASCPVFQNQCLMKGQKVYAIRVDGANRKWIGTKNGAFLLSEDGTELIHHFTTENSPLFNNEIVNIDIDRATGEVFFGTQKGVIGFMGEAIEGKVNTTNLFAFPNPVFTDFEDDIVIRGMLANSEVKITNTAGMLVRTLNSLGGQATWDGRDMWGNKVRSGVYLAMVADQAGKNSGITKIAIVERR